VILHAIRARLRAMFSPLATDREFEEEMRLHIEREVERNTSAGMSRADASYAARRAFGNLPVLQEAARDALGARFVHDLLADIRHSARVLRIRPMFTLTAALTLALGIGATTAMFSVAWGVALRPLPFAHANKLIALCERSASMSPSFCVLSPPNMLDVKRLSPSIEALGLGRLESVSITTPDGTESVRSAIITPDLLKVFAVGVQRGRQLVDADMIGSPSVAAVISDAFWHTRFGGDSVIGQSLNVDGRVVTIVGVLPPMVDIPGLEGAAIWRPLYVDPRDETNRYWAGLEAFGRLREGRSIAVARREVANAAVSLRTRNFSQKPDWDLSVVSLADLVLGNARHLLLLFAAAVALLLLLACANVANLILAQSGGRRHEMGIRAALGATRRRLIRLQLTESLLLSLLGTAAGLGIAVVGVRAFKRFAPPGLPRLDEVGLDTNVLLFAAAVAATTAMLCGLVPAIQASRGGTWRILMDGGRTGTVGRRGFGSGLVIGQIAMATTLVAGAGFLTRSFIALSAWNPGIATAQISTFSVDASVARYPDLSQLARLWSAVERELRTIPGVEAVTLASAGPLFGGGDGSRDFRVQGMSAASPSLWDDVSPGFFRSIGVSVVRGRELAEDDRIGTPLVAVVNESFARQYWRGADAVGRRVGLGLSSADTTATVVGVVADIPPVTPGAPTAPTIYWSNRQKPRYFTYVLVRTAVPPASISATVRERLRAVDRDLRPSRSRTIADFLDDVLRVPRFNMVLLGAFGFTAVLLAAIGTYGLLAYRVSQRDREMGIRLALGAAPRQIARLVLRDGATLAASGLALGFVGALLAGRAVASLVQGISPTDALTLFGSIVMLGAITALACVVPAWRASHVEPASSLSRD
jgi:predicted permease